MDFFGVDLPKVSSFEGVHRSCHTIKELVGDLDKSWGNSKEWMLQLRDGKQIVIPLLFYQSLDSKSDCSVTEGETGPGDNCFVTKRKIVSWADKRDKVVDSLTVVNGLEDELWELDERFMTWERGREPLVVVPLVTEISLEIECNSGMDLGVRRMLIAINYHCG